MDPAVCSGPASCRWCSLWGALAFGEEGPPRVDTSSPGPDVTASLGNASPSTTRIRHMEAPAHWVAVDVPIIDRKGRGRDADFLAARKSSGILYKPEVEERMRRAHERECLRWVEDGEIDFTFWCTFDFDHVWSALVNIALQPFVLKSYIGVTTNCKWRWQLCAGYNNMCPHKDTYTKMFVLTCQSGDAACAMEKLLQAKFSELFPNHSSHVAYRRGPVRSHDQLFLYVCVSWRTPLA